MSVHRSIGIAVLTTLILALPAPAYSCEQIMNRISPARRRGLALAAHGPVGPPRAEAIGVALLPAGAARRNQR